MDSESTLRLGVLQPPLVTLSQRPMRRADPRAPLIDLGYWLQITIIAVVFLSRFGLVVLTIGDRYFVEGAVAFSLVTFAVANPKLRQCLSHMLGRRVFLLGCGGAIGLFVIGVMNNDFVASYADLRACIGLVTAYCLVDAPKPNPPAKRSVLLHLAFMALVLDVVASKLLNDPTNVKSGCNIIACPLLLYLAAREKKTTLFLAGSALSAYLALISFYRTYWIVVIISIVGFGTIMFFTKHARRGLLFACATIALVFLARSNLVRNYFHSSEARYIQSIGKTNNLIAALSEGRELKAGDDIRLAYFTFIVQNPVSLVLPHGLGSRAVFGDIDPFFDRFAIPANTADSGIFYMAFHFGLGISLLLCLLLYTRLRRRLRGTRTADRLYVICGLAAVTVYLLTVGDVFVVIQRAAFGGAFLGTLLNRYL